MNPVVTPALGCRPGQSPAAQCSPNSDRRTPTTSNASQRRLLLFSSFPLESIVVRQKSGRAKREIGLEQDADQSVKETGNSL